jgi:glucokinase
MRIVAADVGGTKTLLALYEGEPGRWVEIDGARFENAQYESITHVLRVFLKDRAAGVEAAALAIAGPVSGERASMTNLPWAIDARAIERELGLPHVRLVNDFEAVAFGVGELAPEHFEVLQDRLVDPRAPAAVIGAGTGLGQAILVPLDRNLPRVIPTEGGHCDFAPKDEIEIALLRFLLQRHARVSWERVVSGPGIEAIYDFVAASALAVASEPVANALREADDRAALIARAALEHKDRACERAIELFVSIYGAEAGNLALKSLPFGGLYVAGGIAPKLLPALRAGGFIAAFRAKGRMEAVLDRVRVSVVKEARVGLFGARRIAASLAAA